MMVVDRDEVACLTTKEGSCQQAFRGPAFSTVVWLVPPESVPFVSLSVSVAI